MEFKLLLAVMKRWAAVLAVAAVAAAVAGGYVSTLVAASYESSARILVGPVSADFDTGRAATTNVVTYAELMTSEPILQATINRLQSDLTTEELREQIEVAGDQTSRIITVTATAPDPDLAALTANILSEELAVIVPPADEAPGGSVSVVSPAIPPEEPGWPNPIMLAILSAIGGFAAALIGLILIESTDTRVRGPHDLERVGAGPFLGRVRLRRPLPPAPAGSSAPVQYDPAAKALVGRLVTERPGAATCLVVPSAESGDESAELAVSLAAAGVDGGWRVLLIDADDVAHVISRVYPGLIGPWRDDADGGALSAERTAPSAPRGEAAARLSAAGEQSWDVVVVHVGPLDRSRLAMEWASAADAAVIGSLAGSTRSEDLRAIVERLGRLGTSIAGTAIVETGGRRRAPRGADAEATRADGGRRRGAAKDSARP